MAISYARRLARLWKAYEALEAQVEPLKQAVRVLREDLADSQAAERAQRERADRFKRELLAQIEVAGIQLGYARAVIAGAGLDRETHKFDRWVAEWDEVHEDVAAS